MLRRGIIFEKLGHVRSEPPKIASATRGGSVIRPLFTLEQRYEYLRRGGGRGTIINDSRAIETKLRRDTQLHGIRKAGENRPSRPFIKLEPANFHARERAYKNVKTIVFAWRWNICIVNFTMETKKGERVGIPGRRVHDRIHNLWEIFGEKRISIFTVENARMEKVSLLVEIIQRNTSDIFQRFFRITIEFSTRLYTWSKIKGNEVSKFCKNIRFQPVRRTSASIFPLLSSSRSSIFLVPFIRRCKWFP